LANYYSPLGPPDPAFPLTDLFHLFEFLVGKTQAMPSTMNEVIRNAAAEREDLNNSPRPSDFHRKSIARAAIRWFSVCSAAITWCAL
jgi:hypothetical protein